MITICEARDNAELEHAAEILLDVFAGHENARMGPGYARALLRSFQSHNSRILLIAAADGQVAGFAAGEPSSSRVSRYRSLRPAAALALLRRPWLLVSPPMLRMAATRLTPRTEDAALDEWFLELIGVHPRAHRSGVGRALLAAFEREGIRRGFTRARLMVHASNDRARTMYGNCGWTTDGSGQVRITYRKVLSSDVRTG